MSRVTYVVMGCLCGLILSGCEKKPTDPVSAGEGEQANAAKASPRPQGDTKAKGDELVIIDAKGNKLTLQRNPPGVNPPLIMYELSKKQSAKYAADKSLARTALTGNIYDNATHTLLCSDAEMQKFREIAKGIDFTQPSDRDRLLQKFIQVFGHEKGRKIGLRIHDDEGRVKYVWPKP